MDQITRIALIYSTVDGQTRQIADHMATHLREMGHPVELFNLQDLPADLDYQSYDGVIFGAPIRQGSFPRSLSRLVKGLERELQQVPTAFYSVSLFEAAQDEEVREEVQEIFNRFMAKTGLHPLIYASFAGALPFSRYGFMQRMLMQAMARRLTGELQIDTNTDYEFTDWVAVDEFVEQFLGQIAFVHPGEQELPGLGAS